MRKDMTPILLPISQEEFWEKIKELLRNELQQTKNEKIEYQVSGLVQKPIFKPFEVCGMLNISRTTLHAWVKEGILKPHKIKSRVYFLWSDLERLITNSNKD